MEPPPSRYRRVDLGWEGSAGTAQLAVASHPLPRVRRSPSPGEWGRWGAPTRPASPPRHPFGGAGPIQDGVTGSDLQGDGRTPLPLPGPGGRLPAGLTPRAAPPAPSPRPRGPQAAGAAPVPGSPAARAVRPPRAPRRSGPRPSAAIAPLPPPPPRAAASSLALPHFLKDITSILLESAIVFPSPAGWS